MPLDEYDMPHKNKKECKTILSFYNSKIRCLDDDVLKQYINEIMISNKCDPINSVYFNKYILNEVFDKVKYLQKHLDILEYRFITCVSCRINYDCDCGEPVWVIIELWRN